VQNDFCNNIGQLQTSIADIMRDKIPRAGVKSAPRWTAKKVLDFYLSIPIVV
jgi:hypothetical protein